MIKSLIGVIMLVAVNCGYARGVSSAEEFATVCEESVRGGTIDSLSNILSTYRIQKSPQDTADEREKMKQTLSQIASSGAPLFVDRMSSVPYGTAILRVRVLEHRQNGLALWTFWAEHLDGAWYAIGLTVTSGGDPTSVLSILDAADAASKQSDPAK